MKGISRMKNGKWLVKHSYTHIGCFSSYEDAVVAKTNAIKYLTTTSYIELKDYKNDLTDINTCIKSVTISQSIDSLRKARKAHEENKNNFWALFTLHNLSTNRVRVLHFNHIIMTENQIQATLVATLKQEGYVVIHIPNQVLRGGKF